MRVYLFLLVIVAACNAGQQRAEPIDIPDADSMLMAKVDSVNNKLESLDSLSTGIVVEIQSRIRQLNYEKNVIAYSETEGKMGSQRLSAVKRYDSGYDEQIDELMKRLMQYENEISYLKKRLYADSMFRVNLRSRKIDQPETIIEKPNDSSLVVEFDTKLKSDGDIPIDRISVYAIPYTKKAKIRKLMQYDISCDLVQINNLNGMVAGYYEGKYFFNGLAPGNYLIKVCYIYGGYELVEKKPGYQVVEMQVSPPIQ